MGVVVAASRKSRWVELTCKAISSGETAPRSQKGQREAFLKVDRSKQDWPIDIFSLTVIHKSYVVSSGRELELCHFLLI